MVNKKPVKPIIKSGNVQVFQIGRFKRGHPCHNASKAIGSRTNKRGLDSPGNIHFLNAPSKIKRKKYVQSKSLIVLIEDLLIKIGTLSGGRFVQLKKVYSRNGANLILWHEKDRIDAYYEADLDQN